MQTWVRCGVDLDSIRRRSGIDLDSICPVVEPRLDARSEVDLRSHNYSHNYLDDEHSNQQRVFHCSGYDNSYDNSSMYAGGTQVLILSHTLATCRLQAQKIADASVRSGRTRN